MYAPEDDTSVRRKEIDVYMMIWAAFNNRLNLKRERMKHIA